MIRVKYILVSWLLLLSIITPCLMQAQQACHGNCRNRTIIFTDFEVNTPAPDREKEPDAYAQWGNLFMIPAQAAAWFASNDPGIACFDFWDATAGIETADGSAFEPGPDQAMQANEFSFADADYIITGKISADGDLGLLVISVETAISRKTVATAQADFRLSDWSSYKKAAQKAISSFFPLHQKIKSFELQERAANKRIALGRTKFTSAKQMMADQLQVIPVSTVLPLFGQTPVDLVLTDCDGQPLANREIVFSAQRTDSSWLPGTSGGKITPSRITTDANGKARVQFIANGSKGNGILCAYFLFNEPSGRPSVIGGSAVVSIQPGIKTGKPGQPAPLPGTPLATNEKPWKMKVFYDKWILQRRDIVENTDEYSIFRYGRNRNRVSLETTYYIEPTYKVNLSEFHVSSGDSTEEAAITYAWEDGLSADISRNTFRKVYEDGTVFMEQYSSNMKGWPVESDRALLSVDIYDSVVSQFGLQLNFMRKGSINKREQEPDMQETAHITLHSATPGVVFEYEKNTPTPGKRFTDIFRIHYFNRKKVFDKGVETTIIELVQVELSRISY